MPGEQRLSRVQGEGGGRPSSRFQLTAALAVAGPDPARRRPGRPCLLTALGTDGSVGCALVRV